MNCSNCDEKLNEEKVFSSRGYSFKCCSVSCLANLMLDVRVCTLKSTLKSMGEID